MDKVYEEAHRMLELIENDKDWTKRIDIGEAFLVRDKVNVHNIYELEFLAKSPRGYVKVINRLSNEVYWDSVDLLIFHKVFIGFL